MRKNITSGFTLIELLVVISIIAVLTAIATVSYSGVQQRARDGRRKADIKAIQQALSVYYQDKGRYPPYALAGDALGDEHNGWCENLLDDGAVYTNIVSTYLKKGLHDPLQIPGKFTEYFYKKTAKGHYQVAAQLENSNDPDKSTSGFDFTGCSFDSSNYPNYYFGSDK